MAKKEKGDIGILKAISGLDDKIAKNLDTICNEIALKNNENFKLLNHILRVAEDIKTGQAGIIHQLSDALSDEIRTAFDRTHNHIDGHFEILHKRLDELHTPKPPVLKPPKKTPKKTANKPAKKSRKR